ncbi:MAG: VOC family protein, partial [Acidimicrobiales bacterium]
MSTRSVAWPAGAPCWVDLATSDVEAAKALYGAALGWETADASGFVACSVGDRVAAGIRPAPEGARPAWTI